MTPVTLHVDAHGFYLYWTDQNKVEHKYTRTLSWTYIVINQQDDTEQIKLHVKKRKKRNGVNLITNIQIWVVKSSELG